MGPGRSSSLHIGGDSSAVAGSGWTGGASDHSAGVDLRDAPGEPLVPLGKDKRRIYQIKYPGGSEYLKSAVQNALAVRPSFVFGIIFIRSLGIFSSALSTCLSSARPDLSPEDNVIAQALAECSPCPYAELIKSDIPGPSISRSTLLF